MKQRLAELVVDALLLHDVDRAYSVPGESFLALLDALHARPELELVTCRHEGSASLAAIADAKLTGRPGVVMASRGPGAFNAALGLHVAQQEAIPLILLIGQVDRPNLGRGAVQEIDSGKAFASVIKWSCRIDSAQMAPEILARAFAIASSGTPGPVVIELPEDVLNDDADHLRARKHGVAFAEASSEQLQAAAQVLSSARRPIMIIGGENRSTAFRDDLVRFSDIWQLPVIVTNKQQDQFPNDHANWAGQLGFFSSPAHVKLLEQADLILAVGSRLGDVSTLGFRFPRQEPSPQTLIHVYPDAQEIGTHFATQLPIVSTAHSFVKGMLYQAPAGRVDPSWGNEITNARVATHSWERDRVPDADILGQTIGLIYDHFERDGIITTDSGNFAGWVHRIFKLQPTNRLLGSACGAMGTGVPSGVSACLQYPTRQVIAFCGDGGFLMNGNELATAVGKQLNLKIVVSNNASYGTIRSHQEAAFPSRSSGTDLSNPDIAALAETFGAKGYSIRTIADAQRCIPEAMAHKGAVVIEVHCDVHQTLDKSVSVMTKP